MGSISSANSSTMAVIKLAGEVESGGEPVGDRDGDYNLYVLNWANEFKYLNYEVSFINDVDRRGMPSIDRKTFGIYLNNLPPLG